MYQAPYLTHVFNPFNGVVNCHHLVTGTPFGPPLYQPSPPGHSVPYLNMATNFHESLIYSNTTTPWNYPFMNQQQHLTDVRVGCSNVISTNGYDFVARDSSFVHSHSYYSTVVHKYWIDHPIDQHESNNVNDEESNTPWVLELQAKSTTITTKKLNSSRSMRTNNSDRNSTSHRVARCQQQRRFTAYYSDDDDEKLKYDSDIDWLQHFDVK